MHVVKKEQDKRGNIFDEEVELKDQVISIRRVTKVVKGGKNLSFSALVAVGNENGQVGIGKGKAHKIAAKVIAPQLTAMSATLKVGQ